MKKYSKEIKTIAFIFAAIIFIGGITAFVYSQVSDFWGEGQKEEHFGGLEFLEKHKDKFVKKKELIDVVNVNAGTKANLTSVYFSDNQNGIACGEKGTALLTTNGGHTWTALPLKLPESNFTDCYVSIDKKIFIIEEDGNLHYSPDFGKTWEISGFKNSFIPLRIKFLNDAAGFITGSNGTILKSADSGKSWLKASAPAKSIIYDIDFRDEKNGIAVGTGGEFLTTSNGGDNWITEKKFSEEYLKRIKYIRGADWITAGAEGKIYASLSNGNGWEIQDLPYCEGIRSIIILDERVVIADSKGSVFISREEGRKWERMINIEGMKVNQLVSIIKKELIAVGDGGQIKRIIIK